jgi:hypothetical protein
MPGVDRTSRYPFTRFTAFALVLGLVAGCGGNSGEAPQASASPSAASDTSAPAGSAAAPARASAPAASSTRNRTYSGHDIAGIFIGMDQAEVEAAIRAYDPEAQFQYNRATYRYTALNRRYETEPFLDAIVAATQNRTVILEVRFSPPPGEPRVVGVGRSHNQRTAPLTQADYAATLIDKYGTPSFDGDNGPDGIPLRRTLRWRDTRPGKVACIGREDVNLPNYPVSGGSILEMLSGPMGNRDAAANVDDCALVMAYTLAQDPVLNARGVLYDVTAAAKAEQAAQEWVRSLQEEASRPGTERPAL